MLGLGELGGVGGGELGAAGLVGGGLGLWPWLVVAGWEVIGTGP